jgi:hypothetical protein
LSRRLFVFLLAGVLLPAPARAQTDWLVTPFLGFKFAGGTSIVDLELAAGQVTTTFGVSSALLTRGIFGAEAELAFTPGYFQRGDQNLWASSYVADLTGNLILTLPPGATREGLRPYAVGGMGVIHAQAADVFAVFRIRRFVPALNLGGGAIGLITTNVGVRFDLRYLRSIASDDEAALSVGKRISYWRATVGLVLMP